MSFLSKIFNGKTPQNGTSGIKFGRFSEPAETEELYDMRTQADDLFDKGKFLDAYVVYFNYLQELGGPAVLLEIDDETGNLTFKLLQGSKIVSGIISEKEVWAESVVAKFSEPDITLLRFLLGKNNDLVYSKFALDGNSIVLNQRCPIKDLSPAAFADMLSEIAIISDGLDEMIEADFPFIIPVDYENIIPLSQKEVLTKTEYLRQWLSDMFALTENIENEPTKTSLILGCILKILYLISPEGLLLNRFRHILGHYYEVSDQEDNRAESNYKMIEELKKIAGLSDEEIEKSLFKTYTVFPEAEYQRFAETAESLTQLLQLPVDCVKKRMKHLVVPMCEYIVGIHLYKHGMPEAANELLLLFWRVLNPDFFFGLGFENVLYNETVSQFLKGRIIQEIERINAKYSNIYQGFSFDFTELDFSSREDFAYTFLFEFKNLQITD
ncbi:MAG: YbjN domain-containing protein [Bacteroidales bacterium]|nr:YbjN domain-containing protein [Bacteroidales bacterium]